MSPPGIEVPRGDDALGRALLRLWPARATYAVSFLLVGTIWVNHHAMLAKFRDADGLVVVLNLFELMVVAFVPFTAAVLASAVLTGRDVGAAAAFYGATLAVGGVFTNTWWWYGVRAALIRPSVTKDAVRRATRRFALGPLLYALAALVGWVMPAAAIVVDASLITFYLAWPAVALRQAVLVGNDAAEISDASAAGTAASARRSPSDGGHPMIGWSSDELARFGQAEELRIASRRSDGSLRPFFTIWTVRDGDDVYVRSAHGYDNPWFQRALHSGQGQIRAGGVERDVTFNQPGPDAARGVTAAYHATYDRYGPAIAGSVVGPEAERTTLRLVPR